MKPIPEHTTVRVSVDTKERMDRLHKRLDSEGKRFKKYDLWDEAVKRLEKAKL